MKTALSVVGKMRRLYLLFIYARDEADYREEVLNLAAWCSKNNLALNTKKTKDIIITVPT